MNQHERKNLMTELKENLEHRKLDRSHTWCPGYKTNIQSSPAYARRVEANNKKRDANKAVVVDMNVPVSKR